MSSNHDISIINFKSREIVYYSVIIIKGLVKNNPKSTCQKLQREKISLNPNSSNATFKVIDGKFKVLRELQFGLNSITLKYCCSIATIELLYTRRVTDFSVLPLYIICKGHDGKFQAPSTEKNDVQSACKRITLGAKLLQSVFAEKLFEEEQGRKTFLLEDECKIFCSDLDYLTARAMSQHELWTSIGREIVNSSLGHGRIKFLAFLSCTRYCGEQYKDNFTHDDIVNITQAYVALGGGGLALFGTACLYTWPEDPSQVIQNFENSTAIDRANFMDDSCYRGTWGTCFSTTLGSALHELCHTFDLGHTDTGIMGRGFDDISKIFVSNTSVQGKMHQNSIEFNEKLDPQLLSERLAEKKKTFCVVNRHRKDEEDGIFWTKSCLLFLTYHKWLNSFSSSKNMVIKFDPLTKFLSSTAGLRVVEIRNQETGMALLSWTFESKILKYSFQLPEDDFAQLHEKSVIMFVEDNCGNIFKHVVNI